MDKNFRTMKNLDFKQMAITGLVVIASLVVYDRLVAPAIDKAVDKA